MVGVWQLLRQSGDDSGGTLHPWAQARLVNVKYYFTEIAECCKQPTPGCEAKIQAVKQFVLCHITMMVVHFLVKAGICSKSVGGVEQRRVGMGQRSWERGRELCATGCLTQVVGEGWR